MPIFDFAPQASDVPEPTGRQVSSAPLQIGQQGQRALSQGLKLAGQAVVVHEKAQDESDMTMARQAILKLQQEENQAISQTSNPEEIRSIGTQYKKKYDAIMNGKDPMNGNPYFRNNSGRATFQKGFMDNFYLKRGMQEKERIFQIERRNTQANYLSAIKMIPQQDYFMSRQATAEVRENVDKMIEAGFYTQAEGALEKQKQLKNLDLERSNRLVAEAGSMQYSGNEDDLKKFIQTNKDLVSNLNELDDTEVAEYHKKLNSIEKSKITGFKIAEREAENVKKREQANIDTQMAYDIATGKVSIAEAYQDESLSIDFRTQLAQTYRKQETEKQQTMTDQFNQIEIETAVFNYDDKTDYNGQKQTKIRQRIHESNLPANLRTHYLDILNNGIGLGETEKSQLQQMDDALQFELGINVTIDDKGDLKGLKGRERFELGQDEEAGLVFRDELDQFQRQSIYNRGMGRIRDLMKRGKMDEANAEYRKVIQGVQKFDNDTAFYNRYVTDGFINTRLK